MSFFGNATALWRSNSAWDYITFGLLFFLIILLIVFLQKKISKGISNYHMEKFLKTRGILEDNKRIHKELVRMPLAQDENPDEDEIKRVGDRLREVLENEALLENKDRLLTQEIERLHKMIKVVEDVAAQKSQEEAIQKAAAKECFNKNSGGEGNFRAEPNVQANPPIEASPRIDAYNEEIKNVLLTVDNLLEKLPDDVIEKFIASDDFKLYQKVIEKAKK